MQESKLILLRHGQSEWNRLNLFTGWVDIPLSIKGIEESIEAGKKLSHLRIDQIFVSSLIRSTMTAMLLMAYHSSGKVPVIQHSNGEKLEDWGNIYSHHAKENSIPVTIGWELNERMYGRLQGMNKDEMKKEFGQDQVQKWRRSFNEAPPEGESLSMTAERTIPYFKKMILPLLQEGKNVLITAHGNSLRSIIMFLEELSQEEVVHLEIATAEPIFYTFDQNGWRRD